VPCADDSIDLVASRHPVVTPWGHIARVLRQGGEFVSQQVGPGSVRELTEAMIGPYDVSGRTPEEARAGAESAGLEVVRLTSSSQPMAFDDVAAIVVFLRKVIWIVPDFTVERFLPQLRLVHERIQTDGPFRATSERFLIVCRKP
jgi:SAM-dependent methyltransferase